MIKSIQDELKELSPVQRTLFRALQQRFGTRLGLDDGLLIYTVRRMFVLPRYAAGKTILRPGESLDLFTVLVAGTVKVTCADAQRKKTTLLQIVSEGQAFGLPSLARISETRRFGAVAHTQAVVGLLTPNALADILDRLDTTRRLRVLRYGWDASIGLLLEKRVLLSLSASDRVWHELSRLAERFPANNGGNGQCGTIALHLTQDDIGQLIGATRPTVNRKLRSLGKDVVSHRGGRYVVHRQPPLASHTNFTSTLPVGGCVLNDDLTRKDVLSCLRQQAAAMGFSPAAVRAFAEHARLVVCAAGTQIALPDRTDALSLIVTGAARIECPGPAGDPLTLLFAKPGWLIPGGPPREGQAGFRAVAQVESCAAILTNDGLARVIATMTAGEFLRFLSFGWRVLSHHSWRTCSFLMMNAQERVWDQLTQLAHDFPASHERGTLIDLEFSATDIARLVGVDEAGVGRILRQLEREGRIAIIDQSRGRIIVLGNPKSSRRGHGVRDTQYRRPDVTGSTPPSV